MIPNAVFVLAVVFLLSWLGPAIDDCSAERDQASAMEYLQRQAGQRDRFERAAQRMCGPQSPWIEVSPGVIQCLTRHGKPAGRKARVHSEAS